MSWQFTPYTLFLLLAAGIVFGLAFLLRRHRYAPGAGALAVMMLVAGLWDLGAGLELSAADHFYKVLWAKLQYLGIVAIPVAWLAFAVVYTGERAGSHGATSPCSASYRPSRSYLWRPTSIMA